MSKTSILFVDENPTFVWVLNRYLQRTAEFLIFSMVGTGYDTLVQAKLIEPQIVLMSLGVKAREDIETIRLLRNKQPDTKIIVLAILDDNGYRKAVLDAGADAYVPKIKVLEDLLPAIHELQNSNDEKGSDIHHLVPVSPTYQQVNI